MPTVRTGAAVHAARLTAQHLAGPPAAGPVAVAERLLAVQAQEPRGFRLAVRSRTASGVAADVERALDAGELVVDWLNRMTLQLVRREDHAWLRALTAPQGRTANRRRLEQEGLSLEEARRGVEVAAAVLADEGPLRRAVLRERLEAAGVRTAGQALVHVLWLGCADGVLVRGPLAGKGEQAFTLARDWLGAPPKVDRDAALRELARRYLAGHGPAADADLARWAGLPLRDVRAGLGGIAGELEDAGEDRVALRSAPEPAPLPPPKLLGPFDPVLLGWRSREALVGPEQARIVTDNGIFRPFALVRGRAVAVWRLRGREIEIDPFRKVAKRDLAALEREAADVLRFLGR